MYKILKTTGLTLAALTLWALLPAISRAEGIFDLEMLAAQIQGEQTSLLVKFTDTAFLGEGLSVPTHCTAKFSEYEKHDNDPLRNCYLVHLWENEQAQPVVEVHILENIREDAYVLLRYPTPPNVGKTGERKIRIQMGKNGFFNGNYEKASWSVREFLNADFDAASPWRWLYAYADQELNARYHDAMMYELGEHSASASVLRQYQRQWVKRKEGQCKAGKNAWRCRWRMTAERASDLGRKWWTDAEQRQEEKAAP
jgi:hypothetical protein